MSKPTPSPSIPPAAQRNSAVPLAVWAAPIGQRPPGPASQWLKRLIDEYAPAAGNVLVLVPGNVTQSIHVPGGVSASAFRSLPDPDATLVADPPASPADLVVIMSQLQRPKQGELERGVLIARLTLRPGGLLAVVTRSRPTRRHPHEDLVTRSTHGAAAVGLGYVQHLIITDPAAGDTETAAAHTADDAGPPLHRTAHLDITIFRLPVSSPRETTSSPGSSR